MKKSSSVPAAFVIAVAASIIAGGCGCAPQREVRRCVDDRGRVIPDYECERYGTSGYYGTGRPLYTPRWIYGGSGYRPGDMATGYRTTPNPSAHIVSPSGATISKPSGGGGFFGGGSSGGGISRGGFGGSSGSHSSSGGFGG